MPLLRRPAAREKVTSRFGKALRPVHVAAARTGAGTVMLVRPTALPRLLGVDSAASNRTAWVVQMLGAREVALGAGALWALGPGRTAEPRGGRGWALAGAACDAADVLVVASAMARGRVGRPAGAAAAATALAACVVGVRSAPAR